MNVFRVGYWILSYLLSVIHTLMMYLYATKPNIPFYIKYYCSKFTTAKLSIIFSARAFLEIASASNLFFWENEHNISLSFDVNEGNSHPEMSCLINSIQYPHVRSINQNFFRLFVLN